MIDDLEIYKSTLDYIPEGISIKDENGIIIYCNKSFCEQLGYHVLELVGKPIKEFISTRFLANYDEIIANHKNYENNEVYFEKPMVCKSGQIVWFHAYSKIITINHKIYSSTYYRNEIDHKRQKALLLESTNKLSEYSFLTSHKLRHPIANILGLINLIDVENLSNPQNLTLIDYLKKTSSQLNEVVHELNGSLNAIQFNEELRIFSKVLSPKLLMLVEDDLVNHFISTSIIEKINPQIKIISFSKPQEAINYFIEGNLLPDLLLLDLDMELMNEWDFLKNIEASCEKTIPIYILKSFVSVKDRSLSKQFGNFKDFIVKPITSEKISEIFSHFTV